MNDANRSIFSSNFLLMDTIMRNMKSENHNEREPRTSTSENHEKREPRTGVSENQGDVGVRTDKSENQNFTKPVISPVEEASGNMQTIEYVDFEGKRVVRNYEKKL